MTPPLKYTKMCLLTVCKLKKQVSPLPLSNLAFPHLFNFILFLPLIINIVIWNFWGALNPSFQSFLHSLVQTHHPAIIIITKTKTSGLRAKNITDRLQFDRANHANNIGFTEGLWVLWDSTQVEVSKLSFTKQEIHAMVRDISSNSSWLMSAIYASSKFTERLLLWENFSGG